MASLTDQRKRVRIIAFNAANIPSLETVNITTAAPADRTEIAEYVQTAGVANLNVPTIMDSAGTVTGLKTIYVAGYTAPA